MALLSVLRRHPRFNIVAFTLTVLVTVGALEAADLWWRRDQELAQAESRARNLSLVLAEYVRGSFTSADTALRQLAIQTTRVGGSRASHTAWDPILAAAHAALPDVGSFTITDRDGTITHSNVKAIVGSSRRDNYIFKQLSALDRDELVVDHPFAAVTSKQYLIPLGRRLVDADGRFDGTVVATVLPEAYRAFFRTLDLGANGVITVLHQDDVVLFREPSSRDPINDPAHDNAILRHARAAGGGVFEGAIEAGGPSFITAYRTVTNPPLVVSVSLLEREVLADWREQRRVAAMAYAILSATLFAVVLVLFRVVSERERVERALADVQRKEEERLRVSNDRLGEALEREQEARRQVEEASYMKDEFLMTVSHELRTPLTAIYGWVRMLATREMPRAEQVKALGAVERNALAQTRLIDDLLDVSRAITGKLRLDARPVDAGAVVRAAVETLTPAVTARQLQVQATIDEPVPPVRADPDRLQQIVWNLLSNAIKFTPRGGRIDIRAGAADDSHVEIVVSDSGSGIPADFLPFVFDRFRQADAGTRRRYGGLGLGLAIVRHLVELHGGTVSVHSDGEGTGATFRVLLPTREAASAEVPAPAPFRAAVALPAAGRLDGVRVLIVEDEEDSRELFAQILDAAGAHVRTASSGRDALSRLRDEAVDVILSDVEMPGMDGYELLRRVRAEGWAAQQRVAAIALTAYARSSDRRRALDAGFDEHVAKPVDPETLVAAIAAVLPSH